MVEWNAPQASEQEPVLLGPDQQPAGRVRQVGDGHRARIDLGVASLAVVSDRNPPRDRVDIRRELRVPAELLLLFHASKKRLLNELADQIFGHLGPKKAKQRPKLHAQQLVASLGIPRAPRLEQRKLVRLAHYLRG